jgi:hypothetical protein
MTEAEAYALADLGWAIVILVFALLMVVFHR